MSNLPYYPTAELEAFYRGRIKALGADLSREAGIARLAIRFCHWTPSGQYAIWAGFCAVLEEAQIAEVKGEAKRPALIFGIHSSNSIPNNSCTAVRDWSGVKYLRYDVDDAGLLSAFRECLAGCLQPLPPPLQANPQALLKLLAIVRHQFEGEIDPIKDRLAHLSKVLDGEPFRPSHAEVPQVFTIEQEKMLERLGGYISPSLALAPDVEGLRPFSKALHTFRQQWEDIAKLALLVPAGDSFAAQAALEGWQQVQLTVEQLINSLQLLEQALKQRLEKIK
ncbi:MAG TPA: hypothetical protein ENN18_08890 [Proteobacteria bacterium]|nr:hypothetical protein [Pseudomonadota bacterium]